MKKIDIKLFVDFLGRKGIGALATLKNVMLFITFASTIKETEYCYIYCKLEC